MPRTTVPSTGPLSFLSPRRAHRGGDGQEHVEPFPADPKILWIVALDLTDESGGNATGIGNADFTTQRLVDKIDMKPTLVNRITACAPNGRRCRARARPTGRPSRRRSRASGSRRRNGHAWVRIKDSLLLGEIEVSEAYQEELANRQDLTPPTDPAPLAFDAAGDLVALA